MEETPVLVGPNAELLLEEFNNLVDELERVEAELTLAVEDVKLKRAAVATVEQALRSKAREIRRPPTELPLFGGELLGGEEKD